VGSKTHKSVVRSEQEGKIGAGLELVGCELEGWFWCGVSDGVEGVVSGFERKWVRGGGLPRGILGRGYANPIVGLGSQG
jgi:hypothetical protein